MCCAGYIKGDEKVIVMGVVEGDIISEMRGSSGFGYDPIFRPSDESRTFGEMGLEEKNEHSHRARAFRLMAEKLAIRER
jgi:XTP/dITP diphosphohydrolase